jgi:hypothetical protein
VRAGDPQQQQEEEEEKQQLQQLEQQQLQQLEQQQQEEEEEEEQQQVSTLRLTVSKPYTVTMSTCKAVWRPLCRTCSTKLLPSSLTRL